MREIRRRTRAVGDFPDGNSAINLAAARLGHIAGTRWSTKDRLTGAGHRPKVREKDLDTTGNRLQEFGEGPTLRQPFLG